MERKAHNSLNEAALQVQLNESDSEKPEQKPKEKSAKPKYKVVHNYTKGGKMSTQYVKDEEVEEATDVDIAKEKEKIAVSQERIKDLSDRQKREKGREREIK